MESFGVRSAALRLAAIVSMGAVAAGGLAACGGDDDASGSSASQKPAPTFSGKPVKIAVNVPIDSPVGSFPQAFAAANATVRTINAAGGIKGHKLVIETCNTKGDPNQEVACAQQAVRSGAIAAVESFVPLNGAAYEKTLAGGDVADVANEVFQPAQATSPNTFPITFGYGAWAGCASKELLGAAGAERASSFVVDVPAGLFIMDYVRKASKRLGTDYDATVKIPANTADMAPFVQQVADSKADIVLAGTALPGIQAFVAAASGTSKDWAYCSAVGGTNKILPKVSSTVADRFYQSLTLPPLSSADQNPGVRQFIEDMKAEEEEGDKDASIANDNYSDEMLQAWVGIHIVKQAAESVKGEITAKSVLAALGKLRWDGSGVLDPIDFSKPAGGGSFPRLFNPYTLLARWDSGKKDLVLLPKGKIDTVTNLVG